MTTRDEIEQAVNDLADNAHAIGWNHGHAGEMQPHIDHVLALIAPTPAPGDYAPTMLGTNPLEDVSEYREDRLKITFTLSPHRLNEWLVKLADSWTGMTLTRTGYADDIQWTLNERPNLGPFRVRGEAVAAAIVTTFDPDNDPAPTPAPGEPTAAEIEAAAKEIAEQLNIENDWPYWLDGAKSVLDAARAARATGAGSK